MRRRPTGEGIGDGDLAVSVAVEEIFAGEHVERRVCIEPELGRGRAHLGVARAPPAREAAQDPEVELQLQLGEPRPAGGTQLGRGDLSSRQRRGDPGGSNCWSSLTAASELTLRP